MPSKSKQNIEFNNVKVLEKRLLNEGHELKLEKYNYGLGNQSTFIYLCNNERMEFPDTEIGYRNLQKWLIDRTFTSTEYINGHQLEIM